MNYMERHKDLRTDPSALQVGAIRSICLTMPYLSGAIPSSVGDVLRHEEERLLKSDQAVVSLYARGRDYHKVIRSRLQTLTVELEEKIQMLL